LSIIAPMAVAVGVPLAFLYLVRRLDLYASGGFGVVMACLVFGLAAFPLAYLINTGIFRLSIAGFGMSAAAAAILIKTVVAPVVEEIGKSLGLTWFARRPEFTYFVDGAIYGFASGTAFAVIENLYYLQSAQEPLGMAVNRAFSTSLMHGSASALVGVAVGRLRYGRGRTRILALVLGWMAAMAVHMSFNRVVNSGPLTPPLLAAAFGIGLGGVGLTMLFIRWGLREEAAWLRETLNLEVGVSKQESAVIDRMADLKTLLAPIEGHFGAEKRAAVEAFLRLQAQLGIKTKTAALSSDPALRAELEAQAADLSARMDLLRREVGVYCMSYVRSILPPEGEQIWEGLDRALAEAPAPTQNLWKNLADRS
jgi:RsiW-degrading membrane proteinase PrsW (M82 family)